MRIGIVGARLAGSYSALLLARQGHEILLFDDTLGREKPCGGGVTSKALRTMRWIQEYGLPHNEIRRLRLRTKVGETAALQLRYPIHIFSRATLDSAIRDAAVREGACFIPKRACRFARAGRGWSVESSEGAYEVEFLVGADGATSSVRRALYGPFASRDVSLALGYYVPGLFHPDTVLAVFQEHGFPGYLWSFPRVDHSSVGILRRLPGTRAEALRLVVEEFIESEYPGQGEGKRFYAARIPCLSRRALAAQRTCGDNWALLGDAAGFADAVTAEGIFYALRSAELLATALRRRDPRSYERAWRGDFGRDLLRAAEWRDRFYSGTLLARAFVSRALELAGGSATVRRLSDEVIAGRRSYDSFRRQLTLRSPRILIEMIIKRMAPAGP